MTTFGLSAFLRLVSSSPRVRRSLVRQRLQPTESGYDFHRGMRLRAGAFLQGALSAEDAITACEAITAVPERRAAKLALERLIEWRRGVPGPARAFSSATYESPRGHFKVTFTPDFAVELEGQVTAIHLWNTKAPPLDVRLTQATLSLFPAVYGLREAPGDLAVFSIRNMRFVRLREADFDFTTLAENLVAHLEELFDEIRHETATIRRPPSPPTPPM